jgi:outer membrane protein TolC
MLSVGYTNDGWSPSLGRENMTTLGVMWSQALPAPGKRRLRTELTRREAERVATDVDRARLRLIADVKRAYYASLLARDLLSLAKEQDATWSELERSVRARYEVGSGTQQEVFRAQVERTRVQQLVIEAESDLAQQRAALDGLLDRPAQERQPFAVALELRGLTSSVDEIFEEAAHDSPELRAAALTVERERLNLALARKDFRPDLAVQAGYMNRGGLDPMWQAGVGITLPLYRKRLNAAVAESQGQVGSAEKQVEAVKLLLRQRTAERVAQISATARIAELYREGILPQGQMALESALANYQTGRIPFINVLEALTSLYRDRSSYLQQVAAHETLKASLYEWSLEPAGSMRSGTAGSAMTTSISMGRAGAAMDGGMSSRATRPTRGTSGSMESR